PLWGRDREGGSNFEVTGEIECSQSGCGFFRRLVDLAFGDRAQKCVGLLFLFQRLMQQAGDLRLADLLGPGAQRAVARNLVMLRRLRGRQYPSVADVVLHALLHHLLAFSNDAEDGVALFRLGLLVDHPERLLQALDVTLGFLEMIGESLLQVWVGAVLGELRQHFHELLLGVVDVLQQGVKKLVHRPVFHVAPPIWSSSAADGGATARWHGLTPDSLADVTGRDAAQEQLPTLRRVPERGGPTERSQAESVRS